MKVGVRATLLACLFLAASVYSLYSGWWQAAGWFGFFSFVCMWAALNDED